MLRGYAGARIAALAALLGGAAGMLPGLAHAGDDPAASPIEVAPVEVRDREQQDGALTGAGSASPDAERGLEDPAFVTVVRVDERTGETTSVAEVVSRTMGVAVRSLGGLGSFSSISVRGAAPGHTAVLVDGVPMSRIASATVDLSRFSLASFSELALYRGGVPVDLGGAALGGALELKTRVGLPASGKPLLLAAGGGSFGARHARARWLGGDQRRGHHLSLGYAGATGDFSYFNDNGTNLDQSDDAFVARRNNGYDRMDAVARYRARDQDRTLEGGGRWMWKHQGIPGSASVQSRTASLSSLGQLLDIRLTRRRLLGSPRLVGKTSAFVDLAWQRYRDVDGEIGVGEQDRDYTTAAAGVSGHLSIDAGPRHLLSAGVEAQVDFFREADALAQDDDLRSHGLRTGAALTLADEWLVGAHERALVRPALRLDWMRTVPIADRNTPIAGAGDLEPRSDVFLSPRLAARVRLTPGLVVKASAGRYFRAPTVVELFGDRGFLVGNPTLRAETGLSADAGLVLAPARALGPARNLIDCVYAEAAAFVLRPHDTIALVTTSGLASVPRNLGDAAIHGIEAGGSLRIARSITLSGNYTFLMTRQDSPVPSYDGKPLPNRPRHQLHGRVDAARTLGRRQVTLWGDIAYVTGNMLDAAGLSPVPARKLVGAGVKVDIVPGLLVGIEGKNLTNHRVETIALVPPPRPDLTRVPRAVADFFGYPLPGRGLYLTIEWQP